MDIKMQRQSIKAYRMSVALEDDSKRTSFSFPTVSTPCLVPTEPNVVVMPLDPSDHSEYAIHFYLKYIHRPINKVYAVYVTENFIPKREERKSQTERSKNLFSCCISWFTFDKVVVDVGPSPGILAELEKTERMNSHRIRASVKRLFASNNVNYEFRQLTGQEPWETIINFRKEVGGTMIIMGSRGEGSVKRHIFGSVSEKVLHSCLVPVLIVKKPQGAMRSTQGEDHVTSIH